MYDHKWDCQQSYWKEKFILKLFYYFVQKVRELLIKSYTIDFINFIPGHIITIINRIGLTTCNQWFHIKIQIYKENKFVKKKLGMFCKKREKNNYKNYPKENEKKKP